MQNLILDNISLILLLPLWIFLIIMIGRFFSVYVNKRITYFLTLLSSFLGGAACISGLVKIKEPIEWIYPFIKINDFHLTCGLMVDKLSLIIASLLFIISFAVQLYSISFMKNEKKNYKFFAFLNLFNFSMAFLLFSPNLFQFYVFWELVGVVSYLLIGFDYKNIIKSEASRRVFLMNRIGDTALITGIILTSYYMYSFVENKTFVTLSFEDFNAISTLLMAYTSTPTFYIICGLFILACAVKSAQIPFYTWLQDAMEAKIPVSALLHSATMVVAGVYLVVRLMPFFTLDTVITKLVLILGVLTAVVCSILASIETHPKKVLAYSTSANLGLMFMALGCVNIKAALIFLTAHAFIKSTLFLLLPNDKAASKINFILFTASGLSLSGIIFSGLASKEILFSVVNYSQILSYIFMFICFMTGFYITRLTVLVYKNKEFKNNINIVELISFLILMTGNIVIYILLRGSYNISEPAAASIGGIALALLLARKNQLESWSKAPKIFERIYNDFLPAAYQKFSDLLNNFDTKIVSDYKPILFLAKITVKSTNWIENNIMNHSISLITTISKGFSKYDKILQTKNVQTYNAYAFIIITIIIVLVILGYTLLLGV